MTEGEVRIDGHDILTDQAQAKKHIGYLPEIPPLYTDMTPAEYLSFVARAKGVEKGKVAEQVEKVMEQTDITRVKDRLIRNLSKGFKQRVGIAMALLGDPEIIILDEPTVGLDPLQIIEIRDLIKELGKSHTVILSSHILAEVSEVCDQVMILSHGRLVASDTLQNLQRLYSENTITCEAKGTMGEIRRVLVNIPGIESWESAEITENKLYRVKLNVKKGEDIREAVFGAFAGAHVPLLSLIPTELSLEDVFLRLTQEADEEEEAEKAAAGAEEAPVAEELLSEDAAAEASEEAEAAPKKKARKKADEDEEYTPHFGSGKGDGEK